ncbi:hypothetical protein B0T11DRAFT_219198 [Plectosphaerella cucumerina]|jgi:nucleoside-diphosphate-sugar epimerase|uniref:NmrA-like domain-containing protein n=1 Tax=Plectosphaerella cucumerina TaxID=40658 RepID=A0A8K0TTY4_9PEZI|nr:hypothetical protein B0T11DRAFT_219198 [Plectosphaerella cucumerina]
MRVAIAGSGGVARYLSVELPAAGIDVVVLTRSIKPKLEGLPRVEQYVTDYSVESLVKGLEGSSTLISAILDYSPAFVENHLRLIEAAKQTTTLRRFIPAEYGGNLEDYPDQPGFYSRLQGKVREALAAQDVLEWTLFSTGWFTDVLIPSRNHWLQDPGDASPINLTTKTITIPGSGKEQLDITPVRDVVKALAKLVQAPKWERYTYVSGEKTTWNEIADLLQEQHGKMTVQYHSLYQLIEDIVQAKDEEARIIAEYGIFSASGAGSLPPAKVAAQRESLFKGIRFRTARDLLEEIERNPDVIV